jgi:hypothetical protein
LAIYKIDKLNNEAQNLRNSAQGARLSCPFLPRGKTSGCSVAGKRTIYFMIPHAI